MMILYEYSSSNDDIVWSCLCEDRDSSKHLSISGVCLRISELHYFIDLTLKYPPRFPYFVQVTIANTTMRAHYTLYSCTKIQKYADTQNTNNLPKYPLFLFVQVKIANTTIVHNFTI